MLAGKYEPKNPLDFTFTVRVNGVVRNHSSLSWAAETQSGLPDSMVSTGSSVVTRSGSITWAPDTAVVDSPFHPIGEQVWAPAYGDSVSIDASYEGVSWRLFTGKITETSFSGAGATSDIRDRLPDFLSRHISIDARGTAGNIAPDEQALRAVEYCGLGTLPSPALRREIPSATLAAHYSNFTLVEVGVNAVNTYREGTAYGVEVHNMNLDPARQPVAGREVLVVSRSGMRPHDSSISVRINNLLFTLTYAAAAGEYVLVKDAREIGRVPRAADDTDPLPVLAFAVGAAGVRVWISRDKSVVVAQANSLSPVGRVSTSHATGVSLWYTVGAADQQQIVGSLYPRPLIPRLRPRREGIHQRGVRGFENTSGWDILTSYCEATLSAIYMDEMGAPIITARERVITAGPVTEVKLAEKAFSDGFTRGANGLYSKVEVRYQEGMVTSQGRGGGTVLYQPDNLQEIQLGDPLQQIIIPPAEEDWHGIDLNWRPVIDASDGEDNREDFNTPTGSFWQIVFEDPARDGQMRWTGNGYEDVSASAEQIGQRAYKLVHMVTNGRSDWKYYLASPSLGVDVIRSGNRGVPMPIIRGDMKITWVENSYTRRAAGAISDETFTLNGKWWLTAKEAEVIAGQLSAEAGQQTVVFEKLNMLFDPRLQLLDTIRIIGWGSDGMSTFDAWRADCVVIGIILSVEGNVPSFQVSLSAKVLTDLRAGKTYTDLKEAYKTYSAIPANASYDAVFNELPERL